MGRLGLGGVPGGLGVLGLTRVLGPGPIRQAQGRLDAGMADGGGGGGGLGGEEVADVAGEAGEDIEALKGVVLGER